MRSVVTFLGLSVRAWHVAGGRHLLSVSLMSPEASRYRTIQLIMPPLDITPVPLFASHFSKYDLMKTI